MKVEFPQDGLIKLIAESREEEYALWAIDDHIRIACPELNNKLESACTPLKGYTNDFCYLLIPETDSWQNPKNRQLQIDRYHKEHSL